MVHGRGNQRLSSMSLLSRPLSAIVLLQTALIRVIHLISDDVDT